jgi:hypothetical protein
MELSPTLLLNTCNAHRTRPAALAAGRFIWVSSRVFPGWMAVRFVVTPQGSESRVSRLRIRSASGSSRQALRALMLEKETAHAEACAEFV